MVVHGGANERKQAAVSLAAQSGREPSARGEGREPPWRAAAATSWTSSSRPGTRSAPRTTRDPPRARPRCRRTTAPASGARSWTSVPSSPPAEDAERAAPLCRLLARSARWGTRRGARGDAVPARTTRRLPAPGRGDRRCRRCRGRWRSTALCRACWGTPRSSCAAWPPSRSAHLGDGARRDTCCASSPTRPPTHACAPRATASRSSGPAASSRTAAPAPWGRSGGSDGPRTAPRLEQLAEDGRGPGRARGRAARRWPSGG